MVFEPYAYSLGVFDSVKLMKLMIPFAYLKNFTFPTWAVPRCLVCSASFVNKWI